MFTDSFIYSLPLARSWPRFDPQYNLTTTVPPTTEPVVYSDLFNYLKLIDDTDESLVTLLGAAGRAYVEGRTKLTLISSTYTVQFDTFSDCIGLRLPRRPVTAVNSITYIDVNGNQQTLPTSQYLIDTKLWTRIRPAAPGVCFPFTYPGQANAVTVSFTAGTSTTAAGTPEMARLAIMAWVRTMYDNREAVLAGKTGAVLPHTFDAIIGLLGAPEVG